MTLYDWFRHFGLYLNAFRSKINYLNATTTTRIGETIPAYNKILGWVALLLILIVILGPLVLFSSLNPATESNLVQSGSMVVSLQVINGNTFPLY